MKAILLLRLWYWEVRLYKAWIDQISPENYGAVQLKIAIYDHTEKKYHRAREDWDMTP